MATKLHHFVHAKDFVVTDYQPRIKPLQEIATAFHENVLRIHSLGTLPIYVVSAASLAQLCSMQAAANLKINVSDTRIVEGHVDCDPVLYKAHQDERKRLMKEHYDAAREGKVTHP